MIGKMNCIEVAKCSPPPGTYQVTSIFGWKNKGYSFGPNAAYLKKEISKRFAIRDKKVPGPGHYSLHKKPILSYSFSKVKDKIIIG